MHFEYISVKTGGVAVANQLAAMFDPDATAPNFPINCQEGSAVTSHLSDEVYNLIIAVKHHYESALLYPDELLDLADSGTLDVFASSLNLYDVEEGVSFENFLQNIGWTRLATNYPTALI